MWFANLFGRQTSVFRHLLAVVTLLSAPSIVYGQLFPVTASITPTQGALTPYIHEWVHPGAMLGPFQATLLFNDLNNAPITASLRISIEGGGASVRSNPNTPTIVNLLPGELLSLDQITLSSLLAPAKLSTGQPGGLGNALPEGIYTICLEVYDLARQVPISNLACNVFRVQHFDVPEWRMLQPISELPSDAYTLGRTDVDLSSALTFSWTARHPPLLMAEYALQIYAMPQDHQLTYEQVLRAELPVFSTTTFATQYVYTAMDPTLDANRTYLAQLSVRDPMGQYNFVNNGVGPIATFQIVATTDDDGDAALDPCLDPANRPVLSLYDHTPDSAYLRWQLSSSIPYDSVFIDISGGSGWMRDTSLDSEQLAHTVAIFDEDDHSFRLGVYCTLADTFIYSATVSTASFPEMAPDGCDSTIDIRVQNRTPLGVPLQVGDSVIVGDFLMVVERIDGGGSMGEAYVVTPLFNMFRPRLAVEFSGLNVNEEYRMLSGAVNTVIDPDDATMLNVGDLSAIFKAQSGFDDLIYDTYRVEGKIIGINILPDGTTILTIVDDLGNVSTASYPFSTTPPPDYAEILVRPEYLLEGDAFITSKTATPSSWTDSTGTEYGRVGNSVYHASGRLDQSMTSQMGSMGTVTFAQNADAPGGFDTPFDQANTGDYLSIGSSYPMSWKALRVGTSEPVFVDASGATADTIFFETVSGYALDYTEGSRIELDVPCRGEGSQEAVYAIGQTIRGQDTVLSTLGGLKVAGYPLRLMTLNVIPVNVDQIPVDIEKLGADLNRIYNPAIVSWQVQLREKVIIDDLPIPLVAGKGVTSQYNGELREIGRILRAQGLLEKGTKKSPILNIIVVPELSGEYDGYMPLNRNMGFVGTEKTYGNTEEGVHGFSRLIAHELGHGAFGLKHSWEQYPSLVQGTSDNLMDYGSGIHLTKPQWDQIHDPLPVLGFWETTEGAGGVSDPNYFCIQESSLLDFSHRCFFDPNGDPVRIPDQVRQIAFYSTDDSDPELIGRLASFVTDQKTFSVNLDGEQFNGYHNYLDQSEVFTTHLTCTNAQLLRGSKDDCRYKLGEELLQADPSSCDCRQIQKNPGDLFDGRVPFSGESLEERLEHTAHLRDESFDSDISGLLNLLNEEAYLHCQPSVATDLTYFNDLMADKLEILFETTGKEFKVVVHETNYPLEQQQVEQVAEQVFHLTKSQPTSAILFIHLFKDVLYDHTDVAVPPQTIYLPQYHLIDPDGIIEHLPTTASSYQDLLLKYYRGISKPYYLVVYKDLPFGDWTSEVFVKNAWITGYDGIYNFHLWRYRQQEPEITGRMDGVPVYDKTLQELRLEAQRNILDPNYFDIERVKNLKEDCMFTYFEQYGHQEAQSDFFNILQGEYVHDNCVYEQIDKFEAFVYPLLDGVSLVPIFGVVPDLVGMSIAGYRGDVLHFGAYTAGVVLHFTLGGKLIEASLQKAVRYAMLSVSRKALIDLEQAGISELSRLLREYCQISDDQATSFATRLKENLDRVDEVCTSTTYQYLEGEAIKGNFDEALEIIFRGGLAMDEHLTELISSRLRIFSDLPAEQIDEVAIRIRMALNGYHPDGLSDKVLKAITESEHGIDLLTSARNWDDQVKFDRFINDLEVDNFRIWVLEGGERVIAWEKVNSSPDWARLNPAFLENVSKWTEEGFDLTFDVTDDILRVLTPRGKQIGEIFSNGVEEFFMIYDDFFIDGATGIDKYLNLNISILVNTGDEVISGARMVISGGQIRYIEDVSAYASEAVRRAISRRGRLKDNLPNWVSGQEAHHYVPVQALKENPVIQAAVEAGLKFNESINGIPLDKFTRSSNVGRHAYHPRYNRQILDLLDGIIANPNINLSPIQSRKLIENLINGNSKYKGIKKVIEDTKHLVPPANKINEINLELSTLDPLFLLLD